MEKAGLVRDVLFIFHLYLVVQNMVKCTDHMLAHSGLILTGRSLSVTRQELEDGVSASSDCSNLELKLDCCSYCLKFARTEQFQTTLPCNSFD